MFHRSGKNYIIACIVCFTESSFFPLSTFSIYTFCSSENPASLLQRKKNFSLLQSNENEQKKLRGIFDLKTIKQNFSDWSFTRKKEAETCFMLHLLKCKNPCEIDLTLKMHTQNECRFADIIYTHTKKITHSWNKRSRLAGSKRLFFTLCFLFVASIDWRNPLDCGNVLYIKRRFG